MKRELNSHNFGFAAGLSRVVEPARSYELTAVVDNSELNRLLSIVFAMDDTGSIQGDLGMLLNENVDPQIINFVKNQLLFDTTSSVQAPLPSWITDDDAVQLRRSPNETMDDYAQRMASIMTELKSKMNKNVES